jgi:putative hemolysin
MVTRSEIFDMSAAGSPLSGLAARAVERLSGLRELEQFYEKLPRDPHESFFEIVRRELGLACDVSAEDLARIPRSGPVVIVANHPFGAAEGIVLGRVLSIVRPDVRLLANHLLHRIPELREQLIFVDPFQAGASRANVSGFRRAIAHLASGGMLATFPAGSVSHLQLDRMAVADPEWSTSVARLVRRAKATVLPVYFPGANGPLFQLAGLLHPTLRTGLLAHALLDRRHTRIEMRIGRPISFSRLAHLQDDEALTAHLRRRTYILANRVQSGIAKARPHKHGAPIAAAHPNEVLAQEVAALPADAKLASNGELDVLLAEAQQIPNVLREIGRLREITFRAVGEGSGNAADLDAYDAFYSHLFLWNREKREIAGAYRIGVVDPIVRRYGISGLYTSTLFRYSPEFFKVLGAHAVELGRSWISVEYQKSYAPLLLLWKGISTFVAKHPQACVLFGPASISNDYSPRSRALMARYLLDAAAAHELMPHVAPRAPFRAKHGRALEPVSDFDELQDLLQEIEAGQRALPVLLRQYLNLGGRVAALNVDRQFSDVLDALIVVDLRTTPEKTLARYMTAEGARAFFAHHAERVAG